MADRSGPLRLIPWNVQEEAPAHGEKGVPVDLRAGPILSMAAVRADRENLAYGGFDPLQRRSSKAAVGGHKGSVKVKASHTLRKAAAAVESVVVSGCDVVEAPAVRKAHEAGGFAKEDLEFRATLPQWVVDLIDADINVPGLVISNRRSDFYEDEDEDGEVQEALPTTKSDTDANFVEDQKLAEAAAGGDGDETLTTAAYQAKGDLAKEDLEFRATLPQWVVDLIDADINVPGLKISNRRSDFYDESEEEDEEEEAVPELNTN